MNPLKQNQIPSLPRLRPEHLENIFNVYQEENSGNYYYNLLQSLVFPQNLPPSFFTTYNVEWEDTWPLISYKQYDTPNLWWIILLANNIFDPTKKVQVGMKILIPSLPLTQLILSELSRR